MIFCYSICSKIILGFNHSFFKLDTSVIRSTVFFVFFASFYNAGRTHLMTDSVLRKMDPPWKFFSFIVN